MKTKKSKKYSVKKTKKYYHQIQFELHDSHTNFLKKLDEETDKENEVKK